MRFSHTSELVMGATRQRVKFLLWPRRVGDETRWLEFARVEETVMDHPMNDSVAEHPVWIVTKFLD